MGLTLFIQLEEAVIDLMGEIEAKICTFDYMLHLTATIWERIGISDEQELKNRILDAVRSLKTT